MGCILSSVDTIKHKAILMLMHIKGSKGRKDSGTDLRYIQELLGHAHSKTTEIYTHVSNRDIGRIKSPLDSLFETENRGGIKS